MPVRWPAELPADTEWAMLVATYAKQTGRVVAYSMAAFRQAFAAGRDLGRARLGAGRRRRGGDAPGGGEEVRRAARHAQAAGRGDGGRARGRACVDVPAVRVGDRVFHGDRELDAAASALGALA